MQEPRKLLSCNYMVSHRTLLISHHLKELRRFLLVTVERSGPFVYYELSDNRILSILEKLNEMGEDLLKTRISF